MSDEELLKQAEAAWTRAEKAKTPHEASALAQGSIAASLLVIARNSLPTSKSMNINNFPQSHHTREVKPS